MDRLTASAVAAKTFSDIIVGLAAARGRTTITQFGELADCGCRGRDRTQDAPRSSSISSQLFLTCTSLVRPSRVSQPRSNSCTSYRICYYVAALWLIGFAGKRTGQRHMSIQSPDIEEQASRSPRQRLSQDGLHHVKCAGEAEREKAALLARQRGQKSRLRRQKTLNEQIKTPSEPTGAPMLKPQFVSPKEFVELTGVSFATVFRRIRDRTLKSTMFGGRRLIAYSEIERLRDAAED
jgi:hypothetical protein